jgi:flagellar capping protein FliD
MSFDASAFSAQNAAAIAQFLGSASSGGFMQAASGAMTSVDDATSGAIATEYNSLQDTITTQNQHIQDDQSRISDMETNLENELTQADAAIATLEEQKTYYTELFQAEYNNGSSGS